MLIWANTDTTIGTVAEFVVTACLSSWWSLLILQGLTYLFTSQTGELWEYIHFISSASFKSLLVAYFSESHPEFFFIIHHLDWMGKVQGFLCTIMFQCLWLRTKLINWVELILPIANYNCSNDTFRNRGNNLQLSQCTGSLCIRLQLRLITCFKMFFNPLRLMPFGSSVYSHPPKIQLFSFSP